MLNNISRSIENEIIMNYPITIKYMINKINFLSNLKI